MSGILGAVGAIGSVIAAVGVIWERWDTLRSRPRADLRLIRVVEPSFPQGLRPAWSGKGNRIGYIENFGSGKARAISVDAGGCDAMSLPDQPRELGVGEVMQIDIDVPDELVNDAFMWVSWTDEGQSSQRKPTTWFPISEEGPLGQVRARQVGWNWFQRAVVRRTIAPQPSPVSYAYGRISGAPPKSGSLAPRLEVPWKPSRWRWRLAKLFRVTPEGTGSVQRALEWSLRKRGLSKDSPFSPSPDN